MSVGKVRTVSNKGVESKPLTLGDARATAKHPDGPERQAQEDKYIQDAVSAFIAEEAASGRTPLPDNLSADSLERLINNGRDNGTGECVSHLTSHDPDVSEDELERHEVVRDRFRSCAEKLLSEPST